jgi:hypothetical protein
VVVRTAAAFVATVALAVLAAGCGGSSGNHVAQLGTTTQSGGTSSTASAGSAQAQRVAFSACMRSRGVPNYPDPDSTGQLPKGGAEQFGVSTSRYQAAQQACGHLLPTGGSLHQQEHQCMQNSDCPSALVQQMLSADRKLARCMRSHGVPNFPDPITDSHGPIFNITKAGISDAASHTRRFETDLNACGRLAGGNAPESFE